MLERTTRRRTRTTRGIARRVAVGLAVALTVGACAVEQAPDGAGNAPPEPMPTLAPMLERVLPGIVSIAAGGELSAEELAVIRDPEFRRVFGLPKRIQPEEHRFQSLGSGIVIDAPNGYIVTTYHLVNGADVVTVTLSDARRLPARVLGGDEARDVAVVQVDARDLVAVPLGDSDRLRVGDYVVAIGHPFGLAQTATLGIVSGLGARIPDSPAGSFIQTDASINPGNSGGALVNIRGELIGINDSLIGTVVSNSGIGFAIPITAAKRSIAETLRQGAAVPRR